MPSHWTSATRSWLTSFFHTLTSHIPPLASSCNDKISNCTTASTSHCDASPTRCPVVDDSISVVLDGADGAIRMLNEHGTKNTTTARSSQARTIDLSKPSPVHPIAVLFQRQELGKAVLGFAVPMTTGLLLNHYQGLTHLQASASVIALSIGFTMTWNGMLLRGICLQYAITLEYFGVGTILVTFFGLVSSFLSPGLVWACWLCCGLSCLPFILCLVLPTTVEEARSAERLDQNIV